MFKKTIVCDRAVRASKRRCELHFCRGCGRQILWGTHVQRYLGVPLMVGAPEQWSLQWICLDCEVR